MRQSFLLSHSPVPTIYLVALAPCLIIWTVANNDILSSSAEWRKISRGLSVAHSCTSLPKPYRSCTLLSTTLMDPLGATASIVTLLQLAGAVIKYLSILKDASDDIKALVLELCTIRGLLSTIKDLIMEESILHESLGGPDGLFSQIESSLQALALKVQPKSTTTAHKLVQKLRWPLRKEEVTDVLSSFERQKTLLGLALQSDQM